MTEQNRVTHCKTDQEFSQAILDAIAEQAKAERMKAGLSSGEVQFALKVSVKFREPAEGNGGTTQRPKVGEVCCSCVWTGSGTICKGECC